MYMSVHYNGLCQLKANVGMQWKLKKYFSRHIW